MTPLPTYENWDAPTDGTQLTRTQSLAAPQQGSRLACLSTGVFKLGLQMGSLQGTILLSVIKHKANDTRHWCNSRSRGFLSRLVIPSRFPGCIHLGAIRAAELAVPPHFLWGRPDGKPSIGRGRNNGLVVCPPAKLENRPLISRKPES